MTAGEVSKLSPPKEADLNDEVKQLFGANKTIKYETCSGLVGEILSDDVMKSSKYMVTYLVKNSKVLLYQGNVKGFLAGYVQKWGSLSHVIVSNAGHLVPTDQAVNSQAMIEDWILEKGLCLQYEFHHHFLHLLQRPTFADGH